MSKAKINSKNQPFHKPRHAQQLNALFRISQVLADGTLQRQILAEVLDILDNELDLHRGTITLLAPDALRIILSAEPSNSILIAPDTSNLTSLALILPVTLLEPETISSTSPTAISSKSTELAPDISRLKSSDDLKPLTVPLLAPDS